MTEEERENGGGGGGMETRQREGGASLALLCPVGRYAKLCHQSPYTAAVPS